MKRRGWLVIVILLIVVAGLLGSVLLLSAPAVEPTPVAETAKVEPPTPAVSTETIVLLHTNDFHGAVEPQKKGSGEIGGLVCERRAAAAFSRVAGAARRRLPAGPARGAR